MRTLLSTFLLAAALLLVAPATWAGDAAVDAENGQSVPAVAADGACGGCPAAEGGTCCGSCQARQKYSKKKREPGELCPCQRARLAREAKEAAAEQ